MDIEQNQSRKNNTFLKEQKNVSKLSKNIIVLRDLSQEELVPDKVIGVDHNLNY